VRKLDADWTVYGSWSRGYRLFPPGFGLRQVAYGVLAPTDGFLDPTTADQLEIGTRIRRPWWYLSVAAYYSFLHDVQQPVPGEWNGMTEIDLDDSGTIETDESIYVTTGADGYVRGIEIDSAIGLEHLFDGLEGWTWHNGFMANRGRVEFDSGEEPLRHTHPPRFLTALRWEGADPLRALWFEFVGDIVGRYDQISESRLLDDPGYLVDPQDPGSGLLRPYGLPGYSVFHARGGVNLTRAMTLTVAVENLLDKEYRTAHSRMDAAGRDIIVGLRASF
jgi:hemoglobin/transferrin/lactoferrin receptor protein